MYANIASSFIAGAIGAALTNPFECITVNMQTKTDFNTREFINREGIINICTRGIVPRVIYNSF
jgi:Mitochondrial carrier protein